MRQASAEKAGLQRRQARLFCSAPVGVAGAAPVEFAGFSGGSEALSVTLALWIFLAAGIWIFQRWGRPRGAPAPASARAAAGSTG
jgi:hypothetical protein